MFRCPATRQMEGTCGRVPHSRAAGERLRDARRSRTVLPCTRLGLNTLKTHCSSAQGFRCFFFPHFDLATRVSRCDSQTQHSTRQRVVRCCQLPKMRFWRFFQWREFEVANRVRALGWKTNGGGLEGGGKCLKVVFVFSIHDSQSASELAKEAILKFRSECP